MAAHAGHVVRTGPPASAGTHEIDGAIAIVPIFHTALSNHAQPEKDMQNISRLTPCWVPVLLSLCPVLASAQWLEVLPDSNVWGLHSHGDTIIVGTYNGSVLVSPDIGATWSDRTGNLPSGHVKGLGITGDGALVCTTDGSVWISDDWGTWSLLGTGSGSVTEMLVKDSMILVSRELWGGLTASFDRGITWVMISDGQGSQYGTSVAFGGDTITWSRYAVDMLLTLDSGATWTVAQGPDGVFALSPNGRHAGTVSTIYSRVGAGWSFEEVNTQILDIATESSYVAACGSSGQPTDYVFLSQDEGLSWLYVESTMGHVDRVCISGGFLFAGGDGLYRLHIPTYLGVAEGAGARGLELWPNPASGIITVRNPGLDQGEVRLDVRTASGQTVSSSTIASSRSGGQVDVAQLPAGTYSITMSNGLATATRYFVVSPR